MQQYEISVKAEKCIFGQTKIDFLDHHFGKNDNLPPPEKTQFIMNYPIFRSVNCFRRFLGMENYYDRFVPNHAQILRLLASTFDRELLAIHLGVKRFRYIFEGLQFTIFASRTSTDHSSPREICHLDFILQFTNDIRYLDGCGNVVANAMFCRN